MAFPQSKYLELQAEIMKIEFDVPVVQYYFKGNYEVDGEDYELQDFKFYQTDKIMIYYEDIIEGNMFIMDNWLWEHANERGENGYEYMGLYVRQYNPDGDVFDLDVVWDFEEIRKEKKEEAIKYLKKVLPKYIRHHLYKPKAIMAKKAQEEFLNELEYGTKWESDSEEEDEEEGSLMLSFDDYIYLLEECVSPKQLKQIKKEYIKKELNDECFEIEWGLELNEKEQKEKDKLEPYECGIKVKIDEDDVMCEFTHYITYNGSSAFAMWLCGVMN